eukprot:scaffold8864_cov122-Isochrysis_galbana.AAC.5
MLDERQRGASAEANLAEIAAHLLFRRGTPKIRKEVEQAFAQVANHSGAVPPERRVDGGEKRFDVVIEPQHLPFAGGMSTPSQQPWARPRRSAHNLRHSSPR